MILRVEVKVDGQVIRVEETEVADCEKDATRRIWDFLYRAKNLISSLSAADLMYKK